MGIKISRLFVFIIVIGLSSGSGKASGVPIFVNFPDTLETENLPSVGTTERVSVDGNGVEGIGESLRPAISGDGRYIAFWSEANNLVIGDTNTTRDIFVHDRETGQTERVSVASDGLQGNKGSGSYVTGISTNGRYVAYESYASNLVLDDLNDRGDVFIHDRQTGQTTLVSKATDGTQGNDDSFWPSISADGRYVAFHSSANNLVPGDTNNHLDVFVNDRIAGETTRISIANDGTQGDSGSWMPSISDDGRYVAFASWATNFASIDPVFSNIYVHDQDTGQTELVSVNSEGTQANDWSSRPSISGDGRFTAFQSEASNLVNGDTNEVMDVYVHDIESGLTSRVSVASDGAQGNGISAIPAISTNGHFVAFSSNASNLVIGDIINAGHIYLYDRQTFNTELISLSSLQSIGNNGGWVPAISADGRFIAFDSNSNNLVCGDTNNVQDIFVRDRSGIVELHSISGRVTTPDITPIPDVIISDGEGHEASTDGNGNYLFEQLLPCSFLITPSLEEYIFTPNSMKISVPPSIENQDFTGVRSVYSFLPSITRNYCGSKFEENFNVPNSEWPVYEDNDMLFDFVNGEYKIVAKNPDWWVAASPDYQAENFSAGVQVRNPGGKAGTYGIIFNLAEDWSHFYSLEIDTAGYFGIWRYSDAKGWNLLLVNSSPFINMGTAANTLKVKREDELIEVYANDHLLASISDNSFVGQHYLGLIVSSFDQGNLDVRFDNFSITPAECGGTSVLSTQELSSTRPFAPRFISHEATKDLR